jgi:hypothetical protein
LIGRGRMIEPLCGLKMQKNGPNTLISIFSSEPDKLKTLNHSVTIILFFLPFLLVLIFSRNSYEAKRKTKIHHANIISVCPLCKLQWLDLEQSMLNHRATSNLSKLRNPFADIPSFFDQSF